MPRMGPFHFDLPVMQAGLAGYSDRAMRVVARRRGCPYAVTEAILDRAMLAGGLGLSNAIDINDEDHPVAGQIMGSDAAEMADAAAILAERGYDTIDLNFACPVKKVKNKARGGWMLSDVERGLAILRSVRKRLPDHPLSVSTRRGFDESARSVDRFWQLAHAAKDLGYVALRVHGRTVEQKYAGRSKRPFLTEVKAAFPDWFIWGSGDVFEPEDAVEMLAETKVDGVWIARGAIGNPWIFRDVGRLIHHGGTEARRAEPSDELDPRRAGRAASFKVAPDEECIIETSSAPCLRASVVIPPPTIDEQRDALLEHFEEAMQIHGEQLAGRRMRKIGIKYARFHPDAAEVKRQFIGVRSLDTWRGVITDHYASGGLGVRPPRESVDEVNGSCEPAATA